MRTPRSTPWAAATLGGAADPDTELAGGPFLALAGGLMLLVWSLEDLLPVRESETAETTAAARSRRVEPRSAR